MRTELDFNQVYSGNRLLASCEGYHRRWLVQCLKCGKVLIRMEHNLLAGKGVCSCRKRWAAGVRTKSQSKEDRLRFKTRKEWRRVLSLYGDRVCERWREDFEAFLKDMGHRPPGKFLCRRTSCCMLRKESCFWGTRKQAEWPETVYLSYRHKIRRLEEIPELKGIRPERLQVLLRYAPNGPSADQTEFLIRRHKRDQVELAKDRRAMRNRLGGGGGAPESA